MRRTSRSRSRSRSRSPRRREYERSNHRRRDEKDYYNRDSSRRERGRDKYSDRNDKYSDRNDKYSDRSNNRLNTSNTSKYDKPTTQSLHAKKLSALDHENFLKSRQKQREAVTGPVQGLWPLTPPRAEFYFGEFGEEVEDVDCADEDEEIIVNDTLNSVDVVNDNLDDVVGTDKVDESDKFEDGELTVVKVKAPSASKPSINSFSSGKTARYGGDMMPGEGTAMAGFVSSGQRIPRRGEIGMDSDQISRFETAGYVMSGSRHHLMNAVRMRKENQVISVEEKRMISQMALEERVKREEEIVKTFRSMVEEKLKKKQQDE